MRILRIIYCTSLLIIRTFLFPFAILRNFYLLRYHRFNYKKKLKNGTKKFFDKSGYMAALRAQMGKDIDAVNSGAPFDDGLADLLRFNGQSDH